MTARKEGCDFEPTRTYERIGSIITTIERQDSEGWPHEVQKLTTIWLDDETGLAVLNRETFEQWIATPRQIVINNYGENRGTA